MEDNNRNAGIDGEASARHRTQLTNGNSTPGLHHSTDTIKVSDKKKQCTLPPKPPIKNSGRAGPPSVASHRSAT